MERSYEARREEGRRLDSCRILSHRSSLLALLFMLFILRAAMRHDDGRIVHLRHSALDYLRYHSAITASGLLMTLQGWKLGPGRTLWQKSGPHTPPGHLARFLSCQLDLCGYHLHGAPFYFLLFYTYLHVGLLDLYFLLFEKKKKRALYNTTMEASSHITR